MDGWMDGWMCVCLTQGLSPLQNTNAQVFRAQQIAKWKGPRPDESKVRGSDRQKEIRFGCCYCRHLIDHDLDPSTPAAAAV